MDDKPSELPPTEPASQASATPRADQIAQELAQRQARGLVLMLMMSEAAALGGCLFAYMHSSAAAEMARQFGRELTPLASTIAMAALPAFAFPPVIIGLALALTRVGRVQRNAGIMFAVILFSFALFWPAVTMAAFMDDLTPPRSLQSRP